MHTPGYFLYKAYMKVIAVAHGSYPQPMFCSRVFLIGGDDATVNEAVPVFMPTRFDGDQMLAYHVTLPTGYFSARSTGPELGVLLLPTSRSHIAKMVLVPRVVAAGVCYTGWLAGDSLHLFCFTREQQCCSGFALDAGHEGVTDLHEKRLTKVLICCVLLIRMPTCSEGQSVLGQCGFAC